MSEKTLSWGLVVATYQREKILPQCISLATQQTRKPDEIIIVDASDNWNETRTHIMTAIAAAHPDIRWIYVPAHQRGLPHQRNQGIDLATADILFLLDDDSLMTPTCAEEIMQVYEADEARRVMGVQAALIDTLPGEFVVQDEQKATGSKGWQEQWLPLIGGIQRFVWKHIFLMNNEVLCVPYNGSLPSYSVPASLRALGADSVKIFHGCRMTFRREVIAKEKFEPLLLYYALNEDMDASYRVSLHGMLLEASRAHLHHFQSNSGRLHRYAVTAMSAMNQAVCLCRYSNNLKRDKFRFYLLTSRRVIAEIFKDALSRRWSFPQVRGILTAFRYAPIVFALSPEELTEWYPEFQKQFVATGRAPSLKALSAALMAAHSIS